MRYLLSTAVIVGFLMITSCNNKNKEYLDNAQENFDNAQENFDKGNFEEALKGAKIAKEVNNVSLNIDGKILESKILDTLFIINNQLMRENRSDSVFLDFAFKMNEDEVRRYANTLIKDEKLKPKRTYNFTISFGSVSEKLSLTGYGLDFYLSDYKIKGLVRFSYFLGELDKLEITLFDILDKGYMSFYKGLGDIRDLFEKKYGEEQDYSRYYPAGEGKNIRYFWRVANKAIIVKEIDKLIVITYQDLIAKQDRAYLKEMLDDAEKESNIEKSKIIEENI